MVLVSCAKHLCSIWLHNALVNKYVKKRADIDLLARFQYSYQHYLTL